ncbi:hypothetical protein H171_0524 [[Clostridium] celerecrescens 18A]|uniref:Uncharacterized protein n=1 Tax=[Clostridium] celerecrescens 18A TaxID=1286362 RepID=A0A2M8Z0V6_9FIRM|nr:hypothetical protein H171_0524 [[Clostridium] celerecrescens 18A]
MHFADPQKYLTTLAMLTQDNLSAYQVQTSQGLVCANPVNKVCRRRRLLQYGPMMVSEPYTFINFFIYYKQALIYSEQALIYSDIYINILEI